MVNPIKHFTLVNYDTSQLDPRVVIYERKMFIRLATGVEFEETHIPKVEISYPMTR